MDASLQSTMNAAEQSAQNQITRESDKTALTMGAFGTMLIVLLCVISAIVV